MNVKRIVDTSFWEDEKVMEEYSQEDKLFMLYLMTNTHTTQLGIYKLLFKQIALELDCTIDEAKALMDRFENEYGNIKYSPVSKEVAIKNYLCYSILVGGKPVFDLLVKESKQVKDKSLLNFILEGALKAENKTVKLFCQYLINENDKQNHNDKYNDNDNDNVNDNDNDNDKSYPKSYNKSSASREIPIFSDYGKGDKK